jgi:hypothetical protein
MKNINEYKKRFYTLMESTVGDVKPLLNEEDFSDIIEDEICYDENGIVIPCDEKQKDLQDVKVIVVRLKQNVANPFGIKAVKYNSETGEIFNGTTSEKITTIEKNLSRVEFARWLRKNRLIKWKQLRDIKKQN